MYTKEAFYGRLIALTQRPKSATLRTPTAILSPGLVTFPRLIQDDIRPPQFSATLSVSIKLSPAPAPSSTNTSASSTKPRKRLKSEASASGEYVTAVSKRNQRWADLYVRYLVYQLSIRLNKSLASGAVGD